MLDTFASGIRKFFDEYTVGWTTSAIVESVDGVFHKQTFTSGGNTYVLRDSNLASGATPHTVENIILSWIEQGYAAVQWSLVVQNAITSGDCNLALNSCLTASTAFLDSVFRGTNYFNVAANFVAVPVAGFTSALRMTYVTVTTNATPKLAYVGVFMGGGIVGNGFNGAGLSFLIPEPQVTTMRQISQNWGRAGMIIPNLGVSSQLCRLVLPGAVCSEEIGETTMLVSGPVPLSWLSDNYETHWFCPESRCILKLAAGE